MHRVALLTLRRAREAWVVILREDGQAQMQDCRILSRQSEGRVIDVYFQGPFMDS